GPVAASSVSVVDGVPTNTTFVSETHPAGWTCTTPAVGGIGAITCTIASLPANPATALQFTVVIKVATGTPFGATISNTVTISGSTADPVPANNAATDSSITTPPGPTPTVTPPGNQIEFR